MATETVTSIQQPAPFIEAAGKTYLDDLQKAIGGFKTADLSKVYGPQFTAGLGALTLDAIGKASGLGTFAPFLQDASALAGPMTSAQQTAYMSPYQQQVIDTTLADFDRQTAKGIPALAANAIQSGAYGGAREGIAQAEYASDAARNRAALQAQLLQQGFQQAQDQRGLDFARNVELAQQSPALAGQQISGLTTLGGLQQAQTQQTLNAQIPESAASKDYIFSNPENSYPLPVEFNEHQLWLISLKTDRTIVPKENDPKSTDSRKLGVRVLF